MTSSILKALAIVVATLAVLVIGGSLVSQFVFPRVTVLNRQVFKRKTLEVYTTHTASGFDTQCVIFESKLPEEGWVKPFLEVCGDLFEDFSSKEFHFVNDQIAYLTHFSYFAVTTNSGKTWTVQDARNFEFCKRQQLGCFFDEAALRIDFTGFGRTHVAWWKRESNREPELKYFVLESRDFGQSWELVSGPK
jgi:hypothetical protein